MSIIGRLRWIKACLTIISSLLLVALAANIYVLVDKMLGIEPPVSPVEVDPDDEIIKKDSNNA